MLKIAYFDTHIIICRCVNSINLYTVFLLSCKRMTTYIGKRSAKKHHAEKLPFQQRNNSLFSKK